MKPVGNIISLIGIGLVLLAVFRANELAGIFITGLVLLTIGFGLEKKGGK